MRTASSHIGCSRSIRIDVGFENIRGVGGGVVRGGPDVSMLELFWPIGLPGEDWAGCMLTGMVWELL